MYEYFCIIHFIVTYKLKYKVENLLIKIPLEIMTGY